MKMKITDRRLKFGSVSLMITLLVITATIIVNAAFSALAYKFNFYTVMSTDPTYDITDNCLNYIEKTVIPKMQSGKVATIYFCDDREIIEADESTKNLLSAAEKLQKAFSQNIKVEFLNVWENPKQAREYGIKNSTDVAIVYGDSCQVITYEDFFLWNTETSTAVAYNGERRFAAGLLKAVRDENPMCYITVNHGELLESYELLYMLADAGYNYTYIDLVNFDIPEDCELLITFDPRQDLIKKSSLSSISEVEKIQNYMENGGNYWFFASSDTFLAGSLENFEEILSTHGAKFAHSENSDGVEECLQIRDPNNAVSFDGYTIFAKKAETDAASILSGIKTQTLFTNATAITPADGYTEQADGSFVSADKKTVFSPLLVTHEGAEAWANGRITQKSTKDEGFTLMSLSVSECENGAKSTLMVCASTAFANEEAMQSTVYGNSSVLYAISVASGNHDAPIDLAAKPFPTTQMRTLSTKNATIITVVCTVVPTLLVAICGAIILIKRKNRV